MNRGDIGEQGFNFLAKGPKPIFTLKSTNNYFALDVPWEPEALIMGALVRLVYIMSICVGIPVKIGVGAFSNQQ